ncbi:MAG: baseplate J/gp47 family protein [Candidatus Levybacteria bacterium]|nr:baseplate J/gp47 family protein [Candidatus Levybacteria bacterium]
MKLPISSLFAKKDKPEYFLALLLRDEKATAVIIEQINDKIKVFSRHEEYFSTSIENATEQEWLETLDKTIGKAEERLPPDVKTHKTVFGVKENWVEEKKIKKDYLLKLKKVCEALDLSPIGFLVITEAIIHHLQEEEGAPVSAIIVEIGQKNIAVSVVRAGRIVETKHEPVGESVPQTVDTVLKYITAGDVLPSRIIIFDGDRDEEHAQTFIAHQWSKSLPFLHVPQISILPSGFDAKAVVFGAASQMGFEVLGETVEKIQTFTGKEEGHSAKKKDEPKEKRGEEESDTVEKPEAIPDAPPVSGDNFGFVMDKDITTIEEEKKAVQPEQEKPEKKEEEPEDATLAEQRRYVINDPQRHASHHEEIEKEATQREDDENPIPETAYADNFTPHEEEQEGTKRTGVLTGFIESMKGITRSIRLPSIPFIPRGGKAVVVLPVILLLIIGMFLLYVYKLKATVTIFVDPKSIDQNEEVIFSAKASKDFSEGIIAAKNVSVSLDGNAETKTTGKKETGTKAKGTVTLYNSNDSKIQLSEGTAITASNGLEYVLDKDVTIASASGDIFSGTKPGTTQAGVTAKAIGSDYNLPSGTKFSVSGNSSVAAKNDSAFSGGTKKEIVVVAKKDIEKLAEELPDSLEKKAKEEIAKKIGTDESFLPIFTKITLTKKDYNKDLGDEAKTLSLKATVTFEGLTYTNDDISEFAKSKVKSKFSEDLTISDEGIENTLKNLKKKSDTELSARLTMKTNLLPKIDEAVLAKELAGKSFDEADEIITKLPQVVGTEATLSPPIPFLPKLLPRMSENISLTVKTNE